MRVARAVLLLVALLGGCSTPKDMRELGYHYDDSTRSFKKGEPIDGWDVAQGFGEFLLEALASWGAH